MALSSLSPPPASPLVRSGPLMPTIPSAVDDAAVSEAAAGLAALQISPSVYVGRQTPCPAVSSAASLRHRQQQQP